MSEYRSNIFGSEKHKEIKKQGKAHMSEYRSNIFGSEKHEGIKKHEKEGKRDLRRDCSEMSVPTKIQRTLNAPDSSNSNINFETKFKSNILRFTEKIKKGPVFICVVCNRCLYDRSVILFKDNYEIDYSNFYYNFVPSFDGKHYICHTKCHTN